MHAGRPILQYGRPQRYALQKRRLGGLDLQCRNVLAGAPEGIIGWIENPSVAKSQHLMGHKAISLILATGGPGMVKAAYSSGVPALGVGPGNTPAVMDETCDIQMAVSSVLQSKTFDNGMICASKIPSPFILERGFFYSILLLQYHGELGARK